MGVPGGSLDDVSTSMYGRYGFARRLGRTVVNRLWLDFRSTPQNGNAPRTIKSFQEPCTSLAGTPVCSIAQQDFDGDIWGSQPHFAYYPPTMTAPEQALGRSIARTLFLEDRQCSGPLLDIWPRDCWPSQEVQAPTCNKRGNIPSA